MAAISFPYRPGSDLVEVGRQTCRILRGRLALHHEFKVVPVIYTDRTELEWQVSFHVEVPPRPDGMAGKGLGGARIALATIKEVVKVFVNLNLYLTHHSPVDLIIHRPGEPDFLGLGNPYNGLAVAFRDHYRR